MVFYPPKWAGVLPRVPVDISISEFMLSERYGRAPLKKSRDPFTCGITGKSYSAEQVAERVDLLARALAEELNWGANEGANWDKTLGVYSVNTIDTLPLAWATHRLGGIVTPANAAYSAKELAYQLSDAKAKALFTCVPLLKTALEAAAKVGIPKERVYLLEIPEIISGPVPLGFKTVSQFIERGKSLPKLEDLKWPPGEGERRVAFLCYSSGTSGLPKGVMISHRNVIANTMMIAAYEKSNRQLLKSAGSKGESTDVILGLLPQNHIYGLIVVCHAGPYRGDQVIVLPKFELKTYLSAIQRFEIASLIVVPPIVITMLRNHETCVKYDLSSVRVLVTGAAPLGEETAADFERLYPQIKILQAYGLTEACTIVCKTNEQEIFLGSSGCLVPGVEARIVSLDGKEVLTYDTPGELLVRSPSVTLGYLHNEEATRETFQDGWVRTGDEAVVRLSPSGSEHIFVVDRIKELIKVKGFQVAPAELEAHILTHPAVADCAVIAIPDEAAGEIPKALVVKSPSAGVDDETIIKSIKKYVEEHKARHKWLKGGVEFIDAVPRNPSGKILRRLLRDREKEKRRKAGSKL